MTWLKNLTKDLCKQNLSNRAFLSAHLDAPLIEGTGEILIETIDRAAGYFTTRSSSNPTLNARTSGVYLRADPADVSILDGTDNVQRVKLIAERLVNWKAISNI